MVSGQEQQQRLSRSITLTSLFYNITALIGIYGALFRRNKEAAFSNYRLWESAGFVIAYAYSTTLCALMKLYVLFSVLVLGILGWIIVEVRHRRKVRVVHLAQYLIKLIHLPFCYCRRHVSAPSSRTARAPHPTPESPQCRRRTTNTTSWRRISWSRTFNSHGAPLQLLLAHTRGSFPLPKNVRIVFISIY